MCREASDVDEEKYENWIGKKIENEKKHEEILESLLKKFMKRGNDEIDVGYIAVVICLHYIVKNLNRQKQSEQ